jgi:hypothetical protein
VREITPVNVPGASSVSFCIAEHRRNAIVKALNMLLGKNGVSLLRTSHREMSL